MIWGKKEDGFLRNFPFFTNISITGDAHGRGDVLLRPALAAARQINVL
jgi:hypothetical protein